MQTSLLKPMSIKVYDYQYSFVIELFSYDCKLEKEKKLQERFEVDTEQEMIAITDKLKRNYNIKDFERFLKEDDEVEYPAHQIMSVYEWTGNELTEIVRDYFRRQYQFEKLSYIDVHVNTAKLYINLSFDEAVLDQHFEKEIKSQLGYPNERLEHIKVEELFPRILEDIVGGKFIMSRLKNEQLLLDNDNDELEKEVIYFFFEK